MQEKIGKKCDISACKTNHSLHATQILPIIVKYRGINVEGNKRFPAYVSSYNLAT